MSRFAQIDAELSKTAVTCKLCRALAELELEDANYIRGLLGNPDKQHKHISKVLKAGDVEVSDTTVARCRAEQHQRDA